MQTSSTLTSTASARISLENSVRHAHKQNAEQLQSIISTGLTTRGVCIPPTEAMLGSSTAPTAATALTTLVQSKRTPCIQPPAPDVAAVNETQSVQPSVAERKDAPREDEDAADSDDEYPGPDLVM